MIDWPRLGHRHPMSICSQIGPEYLFGFLWNGRGPPLLADRRGDSIRIVFRQTTSSRGVIDVRFPHSLLSLMGPVLWRLPSPSPSVEPRETSPIVYGSIHFEERQKRHTGERGTVWFSSILVFSLLLVFTFVSGQDDIRRRGISQVSRIQSGLGDFPSPGLTSNLVWPEAHTYTHSCKHFDIVLLKSHIFYLDVQGKVLT